MKTLPELDEFLQAAQQADLVAVYRQVMSDTLTPVTAWSILDDGESVGGLFESVVGGERIGRYSLIGIGPHKTLRAWGNRVEISTAAGPTERLEVEDPLELLRQAVGEPRVHTWPGLPPVLGGAIGYAAYDVIRYVEHLPNPPPDDRGLPDLEFGFYNRLVVFDSVRKTAYVIALVDTSATDLASEYRRTCEEIDAVVCKLAAGQHRLQLMDVPPSGPHPQLPRSNFTRQGFCDAVRKCTEYIAAGDIFQVVLSQRFEIDSDADPFEVYRSLRMINPSPFMFYLRTRDATLVGASPEVMCRVVDDQIVVRPLAGTRPRGRDEVEDRRLAEELLQDEKERAEHVMLVDLGRNDVGRVAQPGSVELSDVMHVEYYSHVMHISSTVTGRLADGKNYMDAFKSALPAGTVSGAPKIRAMEILDEIEPTRRGPYAGAIGYFDYRGNTDTCIALRTLVFCGGKAYIQAGAGIVADSVPEMEYEETVNKSRAMLRAITDTNRRVSEQR